MNALVKAIFGFYGLAFVVCIVLLVFIIIRRSKIKKKENFEKRDN